MLSLQPLYELDHFIVNCVLFEHWNRSVNELVNKTDLSIINIELFQVLYLIIRCNYHIVNCFEELLVLLLPSF